MHDVRVRHIAVGEHHLSRVHARDQRGEVLFREDRNALRIEWARELGRVALSGDVWEICAAVNPTTVVPRIVLGRRR